jgi:hypothetical protein
VSGDGFLVPPRSRIKIRVLARQVRALYRRVTGRDEPWFPIVGFVDVVVPLVDEDFQLQVVSKGELGNAHGMTYPDRNIMQIREDVYEGGRRGVGRDRLTIAHEVGHWLMHSDLGLARVRATARSEPFRSSEWQANAFGGELLVSADHIHLCKSAKEAALLFGVSTEAAAYQWKKFREEGLVK